MSLKLSLSNFWSNRDGSKKSSKAGEIWSKLEQVSDEVTSQKKKEEELGLSEEEFIFYQAMSEGKEYAKSEKDLKEKNRISKHNKWFCK